MEKNISSIFYFYGSKGTKKFERDIGRLAFEKDNNELKSSKLSEIRHFIQGV